MEEVKSYEAYHISDMCYQEDMILNTTRFKRSLENFGHYKKAIELEAECVRVGVDPNLPSRKTCLFVCNKNYVRYWHTYIEKRRQRQCYIYKLELNGKLLWTYADYLKAGECEKYWHPETEPDFKEHEGLFVGSYKIISMCNKADFPEIR